MGKNLVINLWDDEYLSNSQENRKKNFRENKIWHYHFVQPVSMGQSRLLDDI